MLAAKKRGTRRNTRSSELRNRHSIASPPQYGTADVQTEEEQVATAGESAVAVLSPKGERGRG
jgi:hypothetical protein